MQQTDQAAFGLLDLGFLELHVFLRNGIIFAEGQFFCLGTRILLGGVEETCVCC